MVIGCRSRCERNSAEQRASGGMLYALSTCGWCRRTKNLLGELGVEYRYVDVDRLEGEARNEAIAEMTRWNPSRSFPTMVLDNKECIVGYQEDKTREALAREST
jgi:glutaredoxin-like protein NrdH